MFSYYIYFLQEIWEGNVGKDYCLLNMVSICTGLTVGPCSC